MNNDELRQQLIVTQEAYQRVVEALQDFVTHSYEHGVEGGDIVLATCESRELAVKALANPPSLEAVERKKLEDEIDALEHAECYHPLEGDYFDFIRSLIAERKAKLEKLK